MSKSKALAEYEKLLREKAESDLQMERYRESNRIEFFDTAPNPGPNPKQAQILEAFKELLIKTLGMSGGNRLGKCLTSGTLVDTTKGKVLVGDLYNDNKPFKVYAWNGKKRVIANASTPFKKQGFHKCYRFFMADGQCLGLADDHRILTLNGGFSTISDLLHTYSQNHPVSTSEPSLSAHVLDECHLNQKQSNCQGGYFANYRPCGGQPPFWTGIGQVVAPLQDDVLKHNYYSYDLGDQEYRYKYSHLFQHSDHPSSQYVGCQILDHVVESGCRIFGKILSFFSQGFLLSQKPSSAEVSEPQSDHEVGRRQSHVSWTSSVPFNIKVLGGNRIECIENIPTCQEVYDFEVEKYHNYIAGDMIHHNTTILTIIGISVMVGKFLWDDTSLLHLFPHNMPRKVRYVGQGWNDHVKAVVIPELIKWWPENRKVKRRGNGVITDTYWQDLKTKSTLEIMSNNQQPKEHEGWSGDLILYDEPCRREIYVANARGLVDRKGKEVFAATLLDEPWIDREIVKRMNEFGKPDKSVFWIEGTSHDNVGYGITESGLDDFSRKLRPEERESRIKGIPQYMSGVIYQKFSRKYRERGGHLVERFQIPLDWMIDIAIDIHPRKEQAILFKATDPRNYKYLVQEIWGHGSAKWVAESIIRAVKYHSYRVNRVIIDPLAKGDSNNDESMYEIVATILMQHGMILETATKDKEHGILEVKELLWGPNQQPSLFVFDDLVRTIYEIEGYMWDKDTQKPSKEDDDMMENLYRLALLKTQWTEPFGIYDYDEAPDFGSGRDAVTGY